MWSFVTSAPSQPPLKWIARAPNDVRRTLAFIVFSKYLDGITIANRIWHGFILVGHEGLAFVVDVGGCTISIFPTPLDVRKEYFDTITPNPDTNHSAHGLLLAKVDSGMISASVNTDAAEDLHEIIIAVYHQLPIDVSEQVAADLRFAPYDQGVRYPISVRNEWGPAQLSSILIERLRFQDIQQAYYVERPVMTALSNHLSRRIFEFYSPH